MITQLILLHFTIWFILCHFTFFSASSHSTSVSTISMSDADKGTMASLGQLMSTSLLIKFGLNQVINSVYSIYVRLFLRAVMTLLGELVEQERMKRV